MSTSYTHTHTHTVHTHTHTHTHVHITHIQVDASGWGRIPMRTADAVRSMVAAAKFDERTLLVCFAVHTHSERVSRTF